MGRVLIFGQLVAKFSVCHMNKVIIKIYFIIYLYIVYSVLQNDIELLGDIGNDEDESVEIDDDLDADPIKRDEV